MGWGVVPHGTSPGSPPFEPGATEHPGLPQMRLEVIDGIGDVVHVGPCVDPGLPERACEAPAGRRRRRTAKRGGGAACARVRAAVRACGRVRVRVRPSVPACVYQPSAVSVCMCLHQAFA